MAAPKTFKNQSSYSNSRPNKGWRWLPVIGLRYRKHVPDAPDWTSAKAYYELAVEQSNQQDAEAAYQLGRIALLMQVARLRARRALLLVTAIGECPCRL